MTTPVRGLRESPREESASSSWVEMVDPVVGAARSFGASAKPSWTGHANVRLFPLLNTSAVERPAANAVSTAFFAMKSAGVPCFSKKTEVDLSRASAVLCTGSVSSKGCCCGSTRNSECRTWLHSRSSASQSFTSPSSASAERISMSFLRSSSCSRP